MLAIPGFIALQLGSNPPQKTDLSNQFLTLGVLIFFGILAVTIAKYLPLRLVGKTED